MAFEKPRLIVMSMTLLAAAACGTASDEEVSTSEESELVTPGETKKFWDRFARDDEDVAKKWASDNGGRAWAGDYLAWRESFRQVALAEMYEATKDPAYLDELVKRIEVVFSLRDDKKNMKDVVRGKVVPAWGRYPDVGRETRTDDWVCEMVQSGLISYPIAAFVRLADRTPALRARYNGERIDRWRDMLVDTVDAFDADWDESGDKGFYRFPKGYARVFAAHEGRYLPYNRALVMGRTMMLLEESKISDSKRQKYRERVKKMARFFAGNTRHVEGRAVWEYATWTPPPAGVEDSSHGGLDVGFIALAGQRSYTTIGKGDIDAYTDTFRRIARDENKIAQQVSGEYEGNDFKDSNETCGRWLDLAALDKGLAKTCTTVIDKGFDEHQAGYAKMLRWRRK